MRIGASALDQAVAAADFAGLLHQKAILHVILTVIGLYFIAVPGLGVKVLGGLAILCCACTSNVASARTSCGSTGSTSCAGRY